MMPTLLRSHLCSKRLHKHMAISSRKMTAVGGGSLILRSDIGVKETLNKQASVLWKNAGCTRGKIVASQVWNTVLSELPPSVKDGNDAPEMS
mmetsp:Transcript_8781/g.11749  ORF Transcript_8781/g.11749 Transcript_8781/m.11749 type:complete len:92 (+) Transcript_8781:1171-1446(+)